MSTYPIVVIEDRYSGVYSGGAWLAGASATDMFDDGQTRVEFCLSADEGPSGSDTDAAKYWSDPPSWIAVGPSPDDALSRLRNTQK